MRLPFGLARLTLSQRLSLVFAILLLACSGASAWLQIRANMMHEKEVVQGLSRGLARRIALDTRLIALDDPSSVAADGSLAPDAVRRLFGRLMAVNPSIEVYLLDLTGKVVGHAAPDGHLKRDRVDLRPILRLLDNQPLPIQGDDPRSVAGRKVFSAALLTNGEHSASSGYIYVVLLGEEHDRLAARVAASSVLRTTLWSMAMVALLGLVAGLVAFRLITRPLRRLTQTMRGFDANAEPAASPPVSASVPATATLDEASVEPGDEIAILEASFGQMAARIGEQWQTVKQLDHERREVVANISHDLRTPLTSLHGYLETLSLKDATLDAAGRQRYLAIALAQSGKVGRLAQALFELARLEHGAVQPEPEVFSLSDLLQDVFQKCELQAEARQTQLTAVLPKPAPLVRADLGMIERVLTNLLDNAIRHAPAGGQVEVAVTLAPASGRDAGKVWVTVSDSGAGIAPALREQLFRRPVALRGERRDGGLGLLIVHRIMQLHGEHIELLDVPGRGAVFRFGLEAALTPR